MNYIGAIINHDKPITETSNLSERPTRRLTTIIYNGINCAKIGYADNKIHIIPLSYFNDIGNGPGKSMWVTDDQPNGISI